MEDKYLFINKFSLSKEICNDVIQMFEQQDEKHPGFTIGGVATDVKDTFDYVIDKNNPKWYKYYNLLYSELQRNIKEYIKSLNKDDFINNNDQNTKHTQYNFFEKELSFKTFQVQRYIKNTGRYIYHNDFAWDFVNKKHRVITFIWYLNDVEEGGETAFNGTTFVKPETGKLVLFPATWTYPHCGRVPISSNKYIITGWIFTDSI
jgi:hypothetical protein